MCVEPYLVGQVKRTITSLCRILLRLGPTLNHQTERSRFHEWFFDGYLRSGFFNS